ncbi:MAG: transposase [Elusimicrobia bacterium]|nr:transposase [Candidatus Liberimonas magnetica]
MPRQGRINIEGGIYHVIQRGIERKAIYKDDADREEFLYRLSEGLKETGHKCHGWVLMPNHFHLLIRTGLKPLSDLMRKLLTGYALYFNKKYKRSGYLYQGRYKSVLCQEDSYLLELVRYIHLNPLRAKIVKDMKGLSNYRWSGHSVIMGKTKAEWQSSGEILEYFGKRELDAIRKYEEFVSEANGQGKREDLTGGGLIRSVGGWKEVLNLRRSKEKWSADERILGDGDFVEKVLKEAEGIFIQRDRLQREGWSLEKLVDDVIEHYKIDRLDLKKKGRKNKISEAKSVIAYYGNKYLGVKSLEIAELFGCERSTVTRLVHKGGANANMISFKALS